jgi:nitroimidazol reductase NimA-like FMN-containing flavoprotein (pyridoxamine 5'-phosphate oxidase superfamily)
MIALLEKSPVGRMATINRKGIPVIKPVNFLYWEGKIYVHSSKKGEKAEDVRRGSPVCFEIDDPVSYVVARESACGADYYYRSIIIKGSAAFVNRRKRKKEILERLMQKYQPEGGYGLMRDEILQKTGVIEISMDEITGKEKLG